MLKETRRGCVVQETVEESQRKGQKDRRGCLEIKMGLVSETAINKRTYEGGTLEEVLCYLWSKEKARGHESDHGPCILRGLVTNPLTSFCLENSLHCTGSHHEESEITCVLKGPPERLYV